MAAIVRKPTRAQLAERVAAAREAYDKAAAASERANTRATRAWVELSDAESDLALRDLQAKHAKRKR